MKAVSHRKEHSESSRPEEDDKESSTPYSDAVWHRTLTERYRAEIQDQIYRVPAPHKNLHPASYGEIPWVSYPIDVLETQDYGMADRYSFPVTEGFWCSYREHVGDMFAQLIASATISPEVSSKKIEWIGADVHISLDADPVRPFTKEEMVELLIYLQRDQEHWTAAHPEVQFWSDIVVANIPLKAAIDPIKWGTRALKLAGGVAAHYGRDLPMPFLAGTISDAAKIISRHARADLDHVHSQLSEDSAELLKERVSKVEAEKQAEYAALLLKILSAGEQKTPAQLTEVADNPQFSALLEVICNGNTSNVPIHHFAATVRSLRRAKWNLTDALSFTAKYGSLVCNAELSNEHWYFDPAKAAVKLSKKSGDPPLVQKYLLSLCEKDPVLLRHTSSAAEGDSFRLFANGRFSLEEASELYVSVVKRVGIGNIPRALSVLELFHSMVESEPETESSNLSSLFTNYLEGVALSHPLLSLLEGREATTHFPGVALYLAAASSPDHGDKGDDCTVTAKDMVRLNEAMKVPVAIRGHIAPPIEKGHRRIPLLSTGETLSLSVTPKALLEARSAVESEKTPSLRLYLELLNRFRERTPRRYVEIMKNYMALCAAKLPSPLIPSDSFLDGFLKVCDFRPPEMIQEFFVHPRERASVRHSNMRTAVDKYLVLSTLLDASVLGLLTLQDVEELLAHVFTPISEKDRTDISREAFWDQGSAALYTPEDWHPAQWHYGMHSELQDYREERVKSLDAALRQSKLQYFKHGEIPNWALESIATANRELDQYSDDFKAEYFPDYEESLDQILARGSFFDEEGFTRRLETEERTIYENQVSVRWGDLSAYSTFLALAGRGVLAGVLDRSRAVTLAETGKRRVYSGEFVRTGPSVVEDVSINCINPQVVGIARVASVGLKCDTEDLNGAFVEIGSALGELANVVGLITSGSLRRRVENHCDGLLSQSGWTEQSLNNIPADKVLGELNSSLGLRHTDLSHVVGNIITRYLRTRAEIDRFRFKLKSIGFKGGFDPGSTSSLTLLTALASVEIPKRLKGVRDPSTIEEVEGGLHTGVGDSSLTADVVKSRIAEARLQSFALYPIGGKVHTLHPIQEEIPDILNNIFGMNGTSFALQHGGTTLLLPPMASSGEIVLLCEYLTRWGVLDQSRPELQLCGPGRLPPDYCAILGASLLLGTTRGVRYRRDSFNTTGHDSDVQFCCMTYDAGGPRLELPFSPTRPGRTDILGRRSAEDATIFQPLHTVLSHTSFNDGPFAEVGQWYRGQFTDLLARYELEPVLSIPWIHGRYEYRGVGQRDRSLHYEKAVKPCIDAYFDSVTRFRSHGDTSGVVFKVRHLFAELMDRVQDIQIELLASVKFENERALLLQFDGETPLGD